MPPLDLTRPLSLGSRDFAENKYAIYRELLDRAPLCRGRIAFLPVQLLSRYDDCVEMLRDPRFVRNRSTATGGGRLPFPMPRSVARLSQSMIVEDDPGHRRLRGLVNKAFTARSVGRLAERVEEISHRLLDAAERQGRVDLMQAYCRPLPVAVIAELVGVSSQDMPRFENSMRVLSKGLSGWSLLRTLFWDLRTTSRFVSELIERKRSDPRDDILTGLIQAEEGGDRLSEDELLSMVFLLIVAGFETTVHLITNGVSVLLEHPEPLERLRAEPERMDSAVEEIVRHRGPIHGTKLGYATQDLTLHGVTLRKGAAVIPLLGAANHDPTAFDQPEVFDIARDPNRHLGFGFGAHYCLGAQLARMETGIALRTLLARNPNLRLAVDRTELRIQNAALWHRHESLPVVLG